MLISNIPSPNFEGAFRIKPNEIKAKNEIPTLFTQGKQVFNDILEKGDQVIVIRNNYDKRIGKYIEENNVSGIEYFPQINTKSGLDSEKPEDLIKLIHDKATKVITDIKEICTTAAQQKSPRKKSKTPKAQKEVEKISNALRLNIEAPQINSTAEATRIRDEQKKRTIEVIMQNKGNSYVYVKPDSPCEDSIRCIIDGKGNIMKSFETLDEIFSFQKRFKQLKQQKINILTDK